MITLKHVLYFDYINYIPYIIKYALSSKTSYLCNFIIEWSSDAKKYFYCHFLHTFCINWGLKVAEALDSGQIALFSLQAAILMKYQ